MLRFNSFKWTLISSVCLLAFLASFSSVSSLPVNKNDSQVESVTMNILMTTMGYETHKDAETEIENENESENGSEEETETENNINSRSVFAAATSSAGVPLEILEEENANLSVAYRQGDLLFHTDSYKNGQLRGSWQLSSRWPEGVLVYRLDPAFNEGEKNEIFKAMNLITAKTCIRFLERKNQRDFVNLVRANGGGCTSYFGRIGGSQPINLQAPSCLRAITIAHEFIHAIGFVHEQSRPDRDDHVTINWSNIYSNQYSNFDKFSTSQVNTFNTPYDFQSIMHYPRFAFAINSGVPTIVPKRQGAICGECQITNTDAQEINFLYKDLCTAQAQG